MAMAAAIPIAMAVVQIGVTAMQVRAQAEAAKANAKLQQEQALANVREAQTAADANRRDVNAQEVEQSSDIIRQAQRELASRSVVAQSMGASGAAQARLAIEVGGAEGIDLLRVSQTAQSQRRAIDQSVRDVALSATQSVATSNQNVENVRTSGQVTLVGTTVGAAASAAGQTYQGYRQDERMSNLEALYRRQIQAAQST